MDDKIKKFMSKNRLGEFQLLQNFVSVGLHSQAIQACDSAIKACDDKILRLLELKELIWRDHERSNSV